MTGEEFAEYELRRQKIESLEAQLMAANLTLIGESADAKMLATDLFHKLQSIHLQRFNTLHFIGELP